MPVRSLCQRVRAIPGIDVPAGKAVEIKPGGYHVMLIDLKHQIKAPARPLNTTATGGDHRHQDSGKSRRHISLRSGQTSSRLTVGQSPGGALAAWRLRCNKYGADGATSQRKPRHLPRLQKFPELRGGNVSAIPFLRRQFNLPGNHHDVDQRSSARRKASVSPRVPSPALRCDGADATVGERADLPV